MSLRYSRTTPRLRYRFQCAHQCLPSFASAAHPFSHTTPFDERMHRPFNADGMARTSLRKMLRHRRRTLSQRQQHIAARGVVNQLLRSGELRRAKRIALYLPADGELDPTLLIYWLRRFRISIYAPVLRPSITPGLWFIRVTETTRLTRNRFNLLEPVTPLYAHSSARCPAWALDIVLMPLVGFDVQGGRLGMGGGFYDRTFGPMQNTGRGGKRPRLIGIAHDVQEVAQLRLTSWDVPLDMIVTGTRYLYAKKQCLRKKTAPMQKTAPA